jgi:dTDP-4-dehydrorhamnose reductase
MKQLIFVVGSSGMLGNYVSKYLGKILDAVIITVNRDQYDVLIHDFSVLQDIICHHIAIENPNEIFLINCLGIIPHSEKFLNNNEIDKKYILINSVFPNKLSYLCKAKNILMIHITTDCVYSGKIEPHKSYSENDIPDETNMYGISKLLGEPSNDALIIRSSFIGEEENHKYSLLEWVKSNRNNKINGYKNHLWNGITCYQCAKIIGELIESPKKRWIGVRHIFSPRVVSKYNLIKYINEIYSIGAVISSITTTLSVNKSLSTIYETNSLFNIPDISQQIQEQFKVRNQYISLK